MDANKPTTRGREMRPISVIAFLCILIGALLGGAFVNLHYKAQTIEQGGAQYDSITGDWGWK